MTNWITKLVSPDTRFEETTAYMLMGSNIVREAVEIGFKEIPISLSLDAYFANAPDKRAAVIASLLDPVKPGDTVFVQFPFFMHINFQAEFFSYIKENRKAKAVAIVHDVMEYMSGRTDYNVDNSFELSWLANKFDLIIAHNEKFAKRLKDDEINLPMVSLHLFDYPHDAPLKEKRFKRQIYYPSGRYADHIDYNGKTTLKIISKFEYDFSDRPNIEAIDSMTSKEILTYMDGGFGLVNSNNISENQFPAQREYFQYNNPTKLSTYIAAGLPFIIPATSAHVNWVKEAGIGLVVDDLNDIDGILDGMTEEDYDQMIENIKPWQKAIRSGFFTRRALTLALNSVELGFDEGLIQFD